MGRLLLTDAGAIVQEVPLQPGVNRIGRDPDNEVSISDESISGRHCEIVYEAGRTVVRDLGSTNGTFLDDVPIQEGVLRPGQTLKVGNFEFIFDDEPEMAEAAPSQPALTAVPAPPRAAPARRSSGGTDAAGRRPSTFFQALPTVFSYPFRKRGPTLLFTGTIFFLLLDLARLAARFAPVIGLVAVLFLTIFGGGFLFSFMQGIITTSASGDDEMPGWPDVSDFWQDLVQPFFRFAMVWIVCILPGILVVGNSLPWGIAVLLLGIFCLPMALLAVAMADSISGLNPLVIFPSIMKVPGAYLVACLMLLLILGIEALSGWLLDRAPVPVIPTLIGKFISLYILVVEMRILGLLYRFHEDRLRWI